MVAVLISVVFGAGMWLAIFGQQWQASGLKESFVR